MISSDALSLEKKTATFIGTHTHCLDAFCRFFDAILLEKTHQTKRRWNLNHNHNCVVCHLLFDFWALESPLFFLSCNYPSWQKKSGTVIQLPISTLPSTKLRIFTLPPLKKTTILKTSHSPPNHKNSWGNLREPNPPPPQIPPTQRKIRSYEVILKEGDGPLRFP